MTALDVVPATIADLQHLIDDPARFTAERGWRVEPGYLEFPGALEGGAAMLGAGTPPEWATHLFVHRADRAVVGLGGFKGPPVNGLVEIGYSIAPTYRGRGLATEAAEQLTAAAAERGALTVRAHTLAEPNASTRVLMRAGFARVGDFTDPEGKVWRWERPARITAR